MKTKFILLFIVTMSVMMSSCYKRNTWGVRGQGENVTETRPAVDFDRIAFDMEGELEFTQDSAYFLEISAQANILSVIKTEIKDGELRISFVGNVWDHNPVRVKVYAPKMKGLSLSGSGSIVVTNSLLTESLNCDMSGSGNITVPMLSANHLSGRLSGSGDIRVNHGHVLTEDFSISGSGDIETVNVMCESSNCRISGSGSIMVNVKEKLNVEISGSGSVKFKGQPIVQSSISGSGRVVHLD